MIFSILITTYNRLNELKITLQSLEDFYIRNDVEFIICVDGSTDGTYTFLKENYPKIKLINHSKSKGLIASRNELLSLTKAKYAISLDDDANFLSDNVLESIEALFEKHPKCGLQAFSIYWDLEKPKNTLKHEKVERVKGFVGCGHVWNMEAWNSIPNYSVWFVFYGEEDFAAFQLFKKDWHIYYNPQVLVHHRVNIKQRSTQNDYATRLRRSLRSGWYLYFLFYPVKLIPRRVLYTLWIQLKTRVFKGNLKAALAIIKAIFDVLLNIHKLIKNSNRLSSKEFQEFSKLPSTKIYWKPNNSNS
ncbi:glycosyltransferase family 2 protein [Pontimicrobium aquaticum]|uniref:Glycosyltransferase family 2 protein n=1 Tax=Pontimicrobium aquaticum TaxID=2565367 RepID=A0A4V5LPV7_9FLAO|nr:glycosyltransferase family 2 protein [Pontimicrobium aquaticum]TJY32899.1 glycosyltransferase family 2 protein [Pontimicrobium aquaticum]